MGYPIPLEWDMWETLAFSPVQLALYYLVVSLGPVRVIGAGVELRPHV